MNTKNFVTFLISSAITYGATAQIATPTVISDYSNRSELLKSVKCLNNLSLDKLTTNQKEALEVLYAYMPLPDIVDYSADFFLENVNYSLKAREEMPWGKIVPDKEFRHFVLPIRVNNENLDGHRKVFYEELKDRVKNLSMEEAILEINHWCHEKATYEPSDSRTHSPLATCYTAIGRCGEESTFTVAALRAMGIPARQIYTPRWAHTDDNHAWVEAWANGKWYFLGACEPEPVLNLGWFNAPASRGMLMTTRVFGNYEGDEEILLQEDGYTNINVTSNYAPTDKITVTVVDSNGKGIKDINVSFRIYNYAEFYALASKKTNASGEVSLSTGLGDVLVWATDGKNYGIGKASVGKDKNITITMDKTDTGSYSADFDIIPPALSTTLVEVTDEQAEQNNARKAAEDAIRGKYTSTFVTAEQSAEIAKSLNLDGNRVSAVLKDARGNYKVLVEFLQSVSGSDRERALDLLEALSTKDRSDVSLNILKDHIKAVVVDNPLYKDYILNPRIDTEFLSEYREYFAKKYAKSAKRYQKNPAELAKEVANNIDATREWDPSTVRMSPVSVDKVKTTNKASRNLYFVAIARSIGIPARIDPVTGKTQYADNSYKWVDVNFGEKVISNTNSKQGQVKLEYTKTGRIDDPKYYTNFTISKIVNGEPSLFEYPEDGTWSSTFKDYASLDEGQYMLVSGQRIANGGVLSHIDIFDVNANDAITNNLVIRQNSKEIQVIGSFNAEDMYHNSASNTDTSIISTTGRGYYVLGLLAPNQEPTNHALRDIAALKKDFEEWGKSIVLLFNDENEASRFDASQLPEMPSTVTYGTDINSTILNEVKASLNIQSNDKPIFIIADTFNRIVFVSQGYTIGLGEQLIDTIHQLNE